MSRLLFPSPVTYSTVPFCRVEIIGAWSLRISNCPIVPGTKTLSTAPSNSTFSGETILSCNIIINFLFQLSLCSLKQLLGLLLGVFDRTDIEECLLGQVVNLTVEDGIEALDGLLDGHHHAWESCKLRSHRERL